MLSSSKLVSHPDRPLWKHLQEVSYISKAALATKYIDPVFASTDAMEYWRRLLVYFHDFGKSTIYFQHKIIQAIARENPDKIYLDADYVNSFYQYHSLSEITAALTNNAGLGSHAELGAFVVQSNVREDDFLVRLILLEVIKRHHGDLKNFNDNEFMLDDYKEEQLLEQWSKANHADYRIICESEGFDLPESLRQNLKKYGGPRVSMYLSDRLPCSDLKYYTLTKFLFSLLLAADKGDMMLENRSIVGSVMRFPINAVDSYKQKLFSGTKQKAIDIAREEAYKLVLQNIHRHISAPYFSITLPTGLGKTFAAYNAAINLQDSLAESYRDKGIQNTIPRIIYCLPFTSIIDQNAQILEQILENINLNDGYLARHHYLSDWPSQKDDIELISDSEKEYFTEGWEYPFTITTFVQLLDTIFSNKNRKLRKFHNLANAIIILDEVQNIPAKYFETVEAIFQALHEYFNTKFIFVTATQPFLIAGKPVVELTDPEKIRTRQFFTDMDRITLDLNLWKNGETPLDVLQEQFQERILLEPDRSFLFIMNKVKDSQSLFVFLREQNPDAEMIYLSAAVLPCLRKERIRSIKEHKIDKQLIVVATQVVEAGVDIDLDIVYRDMAPLDSINQSAGRCNRNGVKGKGVVRLFSSTKGTSIYDGVLINITTGVINDAVEKFGCVIPESAFYELNESYALEIRKKIATESAHSKLIEQMHHLQFETVSKSFKLIDEQFNRYSVFVDFSEESNLVWKEYVSLAKIQDRWERKKEMRKLRPALLQYIVQFPEHAIPSHLQDSEKPIVYLAKNEYEKYYDLITGYGIYREPKSNEAISI